MHPYAENFSQFMSNKLLLKEYLFASIHDFV